MQVQLLFLSLMIAILDVPSLNNHLAGLVGSCLRQQYFPTFVLDSDWIEQHTTKVDYIADAIHVVGHSAVLPRVRAWSAKLTQSASIRGNNINRQTNTTETINQKISACCCYLRRSATNQHCSAATIFHLDLISQIAFFQAKRQYQSQFMIVAKA